MLRALVLLLAADMVHKGAFQRGIRVAMVVKDEVQLKTPDEDDDKAVTVDSIVAEIICKKDNAKMLELTINS